MPILTHSATFLDWYIWRTFVNFVNILVNIVKVVSKYSPCLKLGFIQGYILQIFVLPRKPFGVYQFSREKKY